MIYLISLIFEINKSLNMHQYTCLYIHSESESYRTYYIINHINRYFIK